MKNVNMYYAEDKGTWSRTCRVCLKKRHEKRARATYLKKKIKLERLEAKQDKKRDSVADLLVEFSGGSSNTEDKDTTTSSHSSRNEVATRDNTEGGRATKRPRLSKIQGKYLLSAQ